MDLTVKSFTALVLSALLSGCASTKLIGNIRGNEVWSVRDTGLLSENRSIVIVNKDGQVVAATGGTVSGPAPLITSITGTVIMAGAVAYSAKTVSDALRDVGVTAKGGVDLNLKVPDKPVKVDCAGCSF